MQPTKFFYLFIIQLISAFNDNLFKNALVILVTYSLLANQDSGLVITLAAGLFILPFLIISPWAGTLADRLNKLFIIRKIQQLQVLIALFGMIALVSQNLYFLLGVLFMLGVQSAFFGPVKYAILPELIPQQKLMRANAWFSGSTFIAILLGTLAGGALVLDYALQVGGLLIVLSLIALIAALFVSSDMQQELNKVTRPDLSGYLASYKTIFTNLADGRGLLVIAISGFWFIGAALVSQFPVWAKDFLFASDEVAVAMFALFALGFALGALLVQLFSRGKPRWKLSYIWLWIMAVVLADALYLSLGLEPQKELLSLQEFLAITEAKRIALDLFLLAVAGGIYSVPLYTQLQLAVKDGERSHAFALNNFCNAIAMILTSILIMLGYSLSLNWLEIGWFLVGSILVFAVYLQWKLKS